MRKNSIKNTRVNAEVHKELAQIIRGEIKDPRIHPMTSVTSVEVRSAEGYIRRQLAKTVNLRNTPEIRFILDESIEYGVSMSKLIDEVTHKDAAGEVQEDGEISE